MISMRLTYLNDSFELIQKTISISNGIDYDYTEDLKAKLRKSGFGAFDEGKELYNKCIELKFNEAQTDLVIEMIHKEIWSKGKKLIKDVVITEHKNGIYVDVILDINIEAILKKIKK